MLEFEQGTNMDSASIEISNRLDQVKAEVRRRGRLSHHDADLTDMMPVMVASR